MNKLCLLLLLSLITYVYLDSGCSSTENPKSADDCKGKLDDNDKTYSKYEYCCYESYSKKSESNKCTGLTKKEYDNIGKYVKISKKYIEIAELNHEIDPDTYKDNDFGKYKIECNSYYLKFGILILYLFLI